MLSSRIAHQISVTPKTIWNWRNTNPDFQSALTEALANRQTSADQRAHALSERATDVLADILQNAMDNHRLRAAQIILNHSTRLRPKPATQKSESNDDYWPEPELPPKVG